MEQTLQQYLSNIDTYGYVGVFAAMLLTGIGLPLPGELTLGLTGYLVYNGQLALLPAIVSSAVGDCLGAVISYQIGYFGRTKIVVRYFSFIMPAPAKLLAIEAWLNKYGVFAVILGRILPVIRGIIPISAGLIHMPQRHYLLGIFSSSIIWCSALIYLSRGLGNNWQQITRAGNSPEIFATAVMVAGTLIWGLIFLRKKLK